MSVAAAASSAGPVTAIMYPDSLALSLRVPLTSGRTVVPTGGSAHCGLYKLAGVPNEAARHGHKGAQLANAERDGRCEQTHEDVPNQGTGRSSDR